jgi:hypothetical protein
VTAAKSKTAASQKCLPKWKTAPSLKCRSQPGLRTPQEDLPLSLRMADQSAVQLPWEMRQLLMRMRNPRCELCEEGKGLLCHVVCSGEYVMRCLHCFTCMIQDDTHTVLIDGFRRGEHSYTACSCSSSVGNIDNLG